MFLFYYIVHEQKVAELSLFRLVWRIYPDAAILRKRYTILFLMGLLRRIRSSWYIPISSGQ